jgi:integrase
VIDKPPAILTLNRLPAFLEAASPETPPFWLLGAFAGLRSAEIERLEWRHIKWEERLIEVSASSSKRASKRLITLLPNLFEWLEPYRHHQSPICLAGSLPTPGRRPRACRHHRLAEQRVTAFVCQLSLGRFPRRARA